MFHLSTVLDGVSRHIIVWKLYKTMKAQDVVPTRWILLSRFQATTKARVVHKPRLLSDTGSSCGSADLPDWLDVHKVGYVLWAR